MSECCGCPMMWSTKSVAFVFATIVAAGKPLPVAEIVEYSGLSEEQVLAAIPEVLLRAGFCVGARVHE